MKTTKKQVKKCSKNKVKKSNTNKKIKSKSKYHKKSKKNRFFPLAIFMLLILFIVGGVFLVRTVNDDTDGNYINVDQFIKKIEPFAKKEYERSGILPSITISQAILESNFGNSKLAKDGKNLFGIKAGTSWKGDKITFITEENHKEYIRADFRKYSSWKESIIDHTDLLLKNPVYRRSGLFKTRNYINQAYSLQKAGYATAKDHNGNLVYAKKIINVINKYNLHKYDIESFN